MTYDEAISAGVHRYVWGMPYEAYVAKTRLRLLRSAPPNVTNVLSVGCGPGDIEAAIGTALPLVCTDIYDIAKTAHPELDFRTAIPDEQFEYIYAVGAVMASVLPAQKQAFIDRLFAALRPGGTLVLDHGYCVPPIDGDVRGYTIDNLAVSDAYKIVSQDSFDVITTVDGVGSCCLRYYPCDVAALLRPYKNRYRILPR